DGRAMLTSAFCLLPSALKSSAMKTPAISFLIILMGSMGFGDANVQQKTQMHFGGAIGSVINVFGRKATHEGIVTDVTIHKNRKSARSGDSGEIVDLDQQKIYYVDYEDKTYTVKTFDELRKEYEDAKARAKEREQKTSKSS